MTDTRSPIPDAACRSPETHCVCVVGKLPLQSIQLSKSPGNLLRFHNLPAVDSTSGRESTSNLLPASALPRSGFAAGAGLDWPAEPLSSRAESELA